MKIQRDGLRGLHLVTWISRRNREIVVQYERLANDLIDRTVRDVDADLSLVLAAGHRWMIVNLNREPRILEQFHRRALREVRRRDSRRPSHQERIEIGRA